MNVRAERRLWEVLPEGRWLSRDEMRDVLRRRGGFGASVNDGVVDAGIGWLVQGQYVDCRDAVRRHPPRAGFFIGQPFPPAPPKWEYRRRPLATIPLEADMRAADDVAVRAAAERKDAANAPIDNRLRELGLLPDANQLQEA